MQAHQRRKIAQGLCRSCGKKPIYKANRCEEHYKKGRESAKRWYAEKGRYVHAQRKADKMVKFPMDGCARSAAQEMKWMIRFVGDVLRRGQAENGM